jgi:hypothetical protein
LWLELSHLNFQFIFVNSVVTVRMVGHTDNLTFERYKKEYAVLDELHEYMITEGNIISSRIHCAIIYREFLLLKDFQRIVLLLKISFDISLQIFLITCLGILTTLLSSKK